jgi:hypothetical protein
MSKCRNLNKIHQALNAELLPDRTQLLQKFCLNKFVLGFKTDYRESVFDLLRHMRRLRVYQEHSKYKEYL